MAINAIAEDVDLPPDLSQALLAGKCVVFVGSGVSTAAGLPGVADLQGHLLADLGGGGGVTPASSLSEIATAFKRLLPNKNPKLQMCQLIEQRQASANTEVFQLLARMPTVHHIFTTNWDSLIESSFDIKDRRIITKPESLSHADQRLTNIYKLHGTITDPDGITVDLSDYDAYRRAKAPLLEKLRSLARENAFLFVGYSLRDENVRTALKECGERTFYYVTLDQEIVQEEAWRPIIMRRIPGDGLSVLKSLVEDYERRGYQDQPRVEPVPVSQRPVTTHSSNPFELYETELMAEKFPKLFIESFVEPIKFDRVLGPGNTIVEGHRGSGKSMILRYLSVLHEKERGATVPFWGFYVKLESGFFDAVVRGSMSDAEWTRYFQHYFNLVVLAGLLKNVAAALDAKTFDVPDRARLRDALIAIATRILRIEPDECHTLDGMCDSVYFELDSLRNDPNYKAFCTAPRALREILHRLGEVIPAIRDRDWYFLLDEWDNLKDDQQRAVVIRLHDRDAELRYKIGCKTLGFQERGFGGQKVDYIHDYEFTRLDHHLFSTDEKALYLDFVRRVADRRLESYEGVRTIDEMLPAGNRPTKAHFDYSGFETLAMLSSGIVREFLELCKDALYYAQPALVATKEPLSAIPPKWQNHAARIHAAIHFNNVQACEESDHTTKLINVMGSTFRAIAIATRSRSEKRRPLTLDITDFYNVGAFEKKVIRDAVSNRLIQLPELPLQPRNVWEGPKQKFILHRLLCPYWNLSVYERYTVPASSRVISLIFTDPGAAIKELTRSITDPRTPPQPSLWSPDDEG